MITLTKIGSSVTNLFVVGWDNVLFLLNLVTPKHQAGHVIAAGLPGHNRNWPDYVPPKEGDSRSACPMLNALANHGILPHDGKNITFQELSAKVRQTFNFAPSFCFFAPKFAADFLNRSYWNDRLDLADLNLHADNAIEHDASLTRHDVALVPDQGKPDLNLVHDLLNDATGKMPDGSSQLTVPDLAKALSKRRADAKKTNKEYSENFFHNFFGSAKCVLTAKLMDFSSAYSTNSSSTMLTIFGGSIADLTPMLTEERFSEKWEPRVLDRYGLTMAKFNGLVFQLERKVDPKKFE